MKLIEKKKILLIYPILFVIFLIRLLLLSGEGEIKVSFLCVGQGAGTFISVNGHSGIMVDGGSSSESDINEYVIIPFLRSNAINEISYWFVSHSDKDHTSGLIEFLESYNENMIKLSNIVLPKYHLEDNTYDQIISLAKSNNILIKYLESGNSIEIKDDYGKKLDVYGLYPCKESAYNDSDEISYKDHNEESEVLYFSYGDFQTILLGDLNKENDKYVIDEIENLGIDREQVEVIEASHHGSKTGTSESLLNKTKVKYCVISAGEDNSYGHPHKELLDRLDDNNVKYFQTKDTGQITFISDGKNLKIRTRE